MYKLVLIGNGFDLAHGFKTSYKDFLDWYMCNSFQKFIDDNNFQDDLIEMKSKYQGMVMDVPRTPPNSVEEVLRLFEHVEHRHITYKSNFFETLLQSHSGRNNWVSIECFYFQYLKRIFGSTAKMDQKKEAAKKLNFQFDYLIKRLQEYFIQINSGIKKNHKLEIESSGMNLYKAIRSDANSKVLFLNFNYTETLSFLEYSSEEEIIHIHGRAADSELNPIIFGYGDESDPKYQEIEDSGENVFLEHIKSFSYFKTDNYNKLISFIDSYTFDAHIVGHSCGLSDRILLNTIFEHQNCTKIEIYYHKRNDGSDNFTEITQEISRHFKPQNKGLMRRKVRFKDSKNIIPQNTQTL